LNPLDFLIHLLGFVAPAFVVALLVALAARLLLPRPAKPLPLWARFAIVFAAGVATLGAGLWLFGRDGKMATYAALVVVVATSEWLIGRGWRT
jgi:hypothetical protein